METTVLFCPLYCLVLLTVINAASVVKNENSAMDYLMKYHYMTANELQQDAAAVKLTIKKAIMDFQNLAAMPMTGELDNVTMEMMNLPRCGVPDMISEGDRARKKRYSAQARWPKTDLTFRIDGVTRDIPNPETVENIMIRALDYWAQVTPLTFTRVTGFTDADIVINFRQFSHGDNNPFDGPGGTLAHAFFPGVGIGGDAHFDDSERYDVAGNGVNLFQVAVHEFGHSLGLGHSNVNRAVMAPFYQGYQPNFRLHADDIAGIQALYGRSSGRPEEPAKPDNPSPPETPCTGNIDAITRTRDNTIYVFQGKLVMKLESGGIAPGWPRAISAVFRGLPDNIDAALFWEDTGKTYFFKGNQFWSFTNTVMDAGYPRPLSSQWTGLPSDIDAAFVWSGNGRTYFIKGNTYYRYSKINRRIDPGYPRTLGVWRGIPTGVRAAFQYSNDNTYFFHDGVYYRFEDSAFRVAPNYPRQTFRWWLGCDAQGLEDVGTTPASSSVNVIPSAAVILVSMLLGLTQL